MLIQTRKKTLFDLTLHFETNDELEKVHKNVFYFIFLLNY